jgi:hypothetical protein
MNANTSRKLTQRCMIHLADLCSEGIIRRIA